MKKFFIKLSIFVFPIILILAFPILILYKSGELDTPNKIISYVTKKHNNVLYGPAYAGFIKSLKVASTLEYKPEILALGDSRVSEIRAEFFNPNIKFYNASLAVSELSDFRTFLSLIPTSTQPKILVVDINQQQFHPGNFSPNGEANRRLMQPSSFNDIINIFITSWSHVYKHLFEGKYTVEQVFASQPENTKLLGLEAIVQLKGFRNDGSYYDGQYVLGRAPMPVGYDFEAARKWIDSGTEVFKYGNEISKPALDELTFFLSECKDRNIYVVGFFPPFPHQVHAQMKDSGKFNYFFQLPTVVKPVFDNFNFEFYDYSDLAALGAADDEALDAAHASEKAYLRLYLDMIQHGSILKQFSNGDYLNEKLKNATSSLVIFPDNFAN
jgi:hypothetical protein